MSKPNMTIAVDFDGVIHDYKNPVDGRVMGAPLPGAIAALESLQEAGFAIIILTVRGANPGYIVDWCEFYDVPYDSITDKKPNAVVYIDDRAIRHINWDLTMRDLETFTDFVEVEED